MNDRLPRKLAAILYADVAGYSRLTGADEDATHKTLNKYLDLFSQTIESHHGQVMHYAGDAILARFEAAVDALSCASVVQQQLAEYNEDLPENSQLHFRIGLNLGDVIEDRGEIYGDGVNIAARLESLADPGGICVSDAVRTAVQKKLDLNYEEMGDQSLKNIEEPVRAYRVLMDIRSSAIPGSTGAESSSSSLEFSVPDRPSVAILPFKSLGSDPDQDYLADGIRLGIQATLVQLSGLFLVNAPALNTYRDSDATATSVGTELDVRYILEGAVQQAGDRIRVTVQLTDVDTKQTIWAERYDRIVDDVFKLQDEITREVISALNIKLIKAESYRVWFEKITSPEAREYFYRGSSYLYGGNKEDNALARQMYEELYRVQPDSVIGPSNISITHWLDAFFNWTDNPDESIRQAAEWAKKAMQYDDNNGIGHAVYGHLQLLDGQYDEALTACSKGVELRASCPVAHGLMGLVLNYCGDARMAVKSLREALQLEKIYPAWMINVLAVAYRDCGEVELSISAAKESMRLNPQKDDAQLILCSNYKLAADHEQARSTADNIIASNPTFRLADYAKRQPYKHPAPLNRVIDALREAGLPE
jgi:class 3 adenylate cyclase/TolB-like protein/Flp pilus assembly protein TadD